MTENAFIDDLCELCGSNEGSGPEVGTPYGICLKCACPKCFGFRRFDDRGVPCRNQPFLLANDCPACLGGGTAEDTQRVAGPNVE